MFVTGSARLRRYLVAIYASGAVALALLVTHSQLDVPPQARVPLLVTSALLFVGELFPIRLWRQGSINEYTFSGAFCLPLLTVGPIALAVLAQLSALVITEWRARKPAQVALFNLSQYLLTLMIARTVVCAVDGARFGGYSAPSGSRQLIGLALAAVAFFLVNEALTGAVLGLAHGYPVGPFMLKYIRDELPVTPIVLGLAPVVLACMAFSILTVPLSLLLIIALRRATASAGEHQIAALHDPLTGLPNRVMLLTRLAQGLREAGERGKGVALLMLDLDHFKEINDTLGHHVGDELLRMVGKRLTHAVRPDDTVARLGGDEFAVVVRDADAPAAADIAQRLATTLSEAFGLVGVSLNVEASVGVAVHPGHGDDAESLIRCADIALYTAKLDRGSYVIYDPRSDQHSIERLTLMGELRHGIENGELLVHYQPKINTRTGRAASVEALVRWQHPVRGILMPAAFIPAAENTGLILPLTERVLDDALAAIRQWRRAGLDVSVAVNVTARHITNLELPSQVSAALQRHHLPGEVLVLEVTESCLMSDPGRARIVLTKLHAIGVRLSIDDFGTGYSSFANLRDLAVNEIKIDRSFVADLETSAANAAIVKSAIDLGHNLCLDVVAEGVETECCLQRLTAMGCDFVQGYLLGRPMVADDLLAWAARLEGRASARPEMRQRC